MFLDLVTHKQITELRVRVDKIKISQREFGHAPLKNIFVEF